jgi:cell wall-associated NlpC family hydrolase
VTKLSVISPKADVHGAPDLSALRGKFESQLVFGETFIVEKEENGWCQGSCAHDGYKGWVEKKYLGTASAPTHIITAARSHVYAEITMKSAWQNTLSFGSRVAIIEQSEKFSKIEKIGWIYNAHLSPIGQQSPDIIDTAKKFLETPYYWGGRSGFGIDCSGLVQVCLALAGTAIPRDTEEQEKAVGTEAGATARTGDIVYFKGHVGIMADEENLLHANAHHMKTCLEPLWAVEERTGGITAIRRI